jgi:solute carrier family 24 (sodium/potassium/calcium exchanger), member 6
MLFSTIGIAASDFFCINLSTIASILGMSENMAGVTFLAFGNGSPDVFSTFAAMSTNSGSLALGELIGAAGFITAVVAGSMALVREFKVGKKGFIRDVGFFAVAAGFSMVFLADGKLYVWECCVMIGFYLFYVASVVTWHWHHQQRRKRRERNALARSNYIPPGSTEIDILEENRDEEDTAASERRSLIHGDSFRDFGTPERGPSPIFYDEDESEAESEQGRAVAAEMSNNMRLTRKRSNRRNTKNPIRPSLVGALEFRSVLSTLQKSSHVNKPIHLRRYSDDTRSSPSALINLSPETMITITGPNAARDHPSHDSSTQRMRAVSMNDAATSRPLDPTTSSAADIPEIGVVEATSTIPQYLADSPIDSASNTASPARGSFVDGAVTVIPRSPTISLSPPSERNISPSPPLGLSRYDQKLAPPGSGFPGARHLRADHLQPKLHLSDPPNTSPRSRSPGHPQPIIPLATVRRSSSPSPISPFPIYTDSPLLLSSHSSKAPSLVLPEQENPSELPIFHDDLDSSAQKRINWWPYNVLPCPRVILATLFPTLCTWREKTIWDKFLSIVSAPSIFLLVVTLPVVEPESKDNESDGEPVREIQPHASRRSSALPRLTSGSLSPDDNAEPEWLGNHIQIPQSPILSRRHEHNQTIEVSMSVRDQERPLRKDQAHNTSNEQPPDSVNDWNRWLIAVQIFTAPLFIMLIIWANSSDDQPDPKYLLRLVLYSLLGSLVVLAILLSTTSPDRVPKYRSLFCFLGFIVSITWISTIANEVVGVLKAFGVILGISDAILGLTVFAVGNSLGDLVANITIAKLGYPVMALSACFGGPMLNTLLGIGCSGLYMLIKESNQKQKKHPGQPRKFKSYEIRVSGTLIISGITLLVTLVSLLVVVPLNKWVMSRRIGWGLIMLWSISTIINLVVEMTGVWDDLALST